MTTIAEGAAAVTAALGLGKELLNVNKAYNDAEFKLKIAEITASLATVKMSLAEAQTLMIEKDQENAALKRSMAFRAELVERYGFKYRRNDKGEPTGYAFCQRCEEKEGKFYQLTESHKSGRPHICPNCRAEYVNNATSYP
jgi:hypothetical protein